MPLRSASRGPDQEPVIPRCSRAAPGPGPASHLHSESQSGSLALRGQAPNSAALPHPAGAVSQGHDRTPLPPVRHQLPSYVCSPASWPARLHRALSLTVTFLNRRVGNSPPGASA
ncbi:hypothetical protein NDU88_002720 [Pleurodeles waltl]|uniref:Uncharacterized protein n=1 Tax=Pleurodeles waltl TaxID=8319 RepID=A0AAV7SCI9_PLEWA|nr:hypothetical protein NDU88_002720 [Pleurodeles waltl]